ncbi:MAG: glutathione S-transferase family protein [Sphingomonadaceae bacterium]|nr:glutathione S-transferase family protein [Sphingomonadaceae bacterium]
MILYGASLSPFVRKVLAFASEKGVELETVPTGLNNQDPDFRKASPFGKIPALRDGDFYLSDSTAIIAYIDALHPEPNLIPTEPRARARAIWFEEFADTMMMTTFVKMFFNRIVGPRFLGLEGDEAAAAAAERDELPPLLDYIESVIPESGWLIEDRLTLADVAVASPLIGLDHLGIALDAAKRPRLAEFAARMFARPSFAPWIERERRMLAA